MVFLDDIAVACSAGEFRSIEGIVSETDIVAAKIDARIVPKIVHDAVDVSTVVRFVVGDQIMLRQLV